MTSTMRPLIPSRRAVRIACDVDVGAGRYKAQAEVDQAEGDVDVDLLLAGRAVADAHAEIAAVADRFVGRFQPWCAGAGRLCRPPVPVRPAPPTGVRLPPG